MTAVRSSAADLLRAQEAVKEMQATLDWATVRSPVDGIVTDKKIDVGDMVTPGQMLLTLFDPRQMQLVASVRESLAHELQVGQKIGVRVDVLKKICSGTVSEIVPEAQSASRSFLVKVTGPCPAGIYTGMFGRIMIPLQEEKVLVIPSRAVRDVGQLELVDVVENGQGGPAGYSNRPVDRGRCGSAFRAERGRRSGGAIGRLDSGGRMSENAGLPLEHGSMRGHSHFCCAIGTVPSGASFHE